MAYSFLFPYTTPDDGKYILTKLQAHRNKNHEQNLEQFNFNRKTNNRLYKINKLEDRLELVFLTKIPEGFNIIEDPKAMLWIDLLDVHFRGEAKAGLYKVDNPLPESSLSEVADLTWTYPQAALMDIIDFVYELSKEKMTKGFQEAIIIGPQIVEFKNGELLNNGSSPS